MLQARRRGARLLQAQLHAVKRIVNDAVQLICAIGDVFNS
jgi:hypothetical protein